MKRNYHGWVIKDGKGNIFPDTFNITRNELIADLREYGIYRAPTDKLVRVRLVEIKERTKVKG